MATFTQTISNGNYDSSEYAAPAAASLTTNPVAISAGTRWGLFYFTNVTVPSGATVSSATLSLNIVNTSNDDPNLDIYCNDVDNASAPSTGVGDISARALTTAKATWNATGIGAGTKTSADFATAVQEVIDRAGWASGNALAVIFDGLAATSFQYYTTEQGSGFEPSISITYTTPGQPTIARTRLVPGMGSAHGHQGW